MEMESDINFLLKNGYCRCPGLLSHDAYETLDRDTDKLIADWPYIHQGDGRFWKCKARDGFDVIYRIHELETLLPGVAQLLTAPILHICNALFGSPWKPRVFALVYKEPYRGVEVPWHRDPVDTEPCRVFNFSFFLDPATPQNGGLEFVPGSHIDQSVNLTDGRPNAGTVSVNVSPRDVVIHDVSVLHGSPCNPSGQKRRSIVMEVCRI